MNYNQEDLDLVVYNEMALFVPHCPVVLVLDTSHSMWGQGLIDLKKSLITFFNTINKEAFENAQIDIETISMGGNLGVIEEFIPLAASRILSSNIRPKGDTPIGAALKLALHEFDSKLLDYSRNSINAATPQLIVLSDGRSSDEFENISAEIRSRVQAGKLICRAIALGQSPDYNSLKSFAGDNVYTPSFGDLAETFRDVGQCVSQVYEECVAETFANEVDVEIPSTEALFLLDGTNMLYWNENKKGITLEYVLRTVEYLKSKGAQYIVYFDASTPYKFRKSSIHELDEYNSLIQNNPNEFIQVPAGTRADDFLLKDADDNPNAIILSQDLYRDYEEQYPWICERKRTRPGMVLSDKIYFPKINLEIPL